MRNSAVPKEKLGKLILNIGSIPAILVGGLLIIGGLLLFLVSMGSQTPGAWVDSSGFGVLIGLIALIPGFIMLGLSYLSRLGPRNLSLTIFGDCIYLLVGLAGVVFLINGAGEHSVLAFLLIIFSPIAITASLSSLLGWWLMEAFHSNSVQESEHARPGIQ